MARGGRTTTFIIAMTPGEAAAALRSATLTRADENVEVLVPHLVPYGVALDGCGCDLRAIGARFRDSLGRTRPKVAVRVCVCRDPRHLPGRLLLHDAAIVIAGRRGRLWRSPAERLAHAVACEGHTVTFVECAEMDQGGP